MNKSEGVAEQVAQMRQVCKKAVIFDLDGVLIDSMPYYYAAWNAAFAKYGVIINEDDFYEREGEQRIKSAREIFQINNGYQPSPRVTMDILNTMRSVFLTVFEVRLFPCTRELLTALARESISLGLVTGSERLIEMFGPQNALLDLFSAVITGCDTREGKPSPEPYELGVHMLKVPKADCCVVENAPLGIQSAKAAGLFCIAVQNTSPLSAHRLKEAGADLVYRDNKELMRQLM